MSILRTNPFSIRLFIGCRKKIINFFLLDTNIIFNIKIKNLIRFQTLITSIFLIVTLGSNKKLDLDEEIDLESDMNMGDMDDDDDELS